MLSLSLYCANSTGFVDLPWRRCEDKAVAAVVRAQRARQRRHSFESSRPSLQILPPASVVQKESRFFNTRIDFGRYKLVPPMRPALLTPACIPQAPRDRETLDIPWSLVVDLAARRINLDGVSTLVSLHQELKLPPPVLEAVFRHLQQEKLVEIRGTDGQNFLLSLTFAGHKFATDRQSATHYAGPAPVSLRLYQSTVRAQTARPKITRQHLHRVFSDLVVEDEVLDQLGPALISQETMFLFGSTGNGKTSLAERTVKVFDDAIVVPYAVEVNGQVISVFDPVIHRQLEGDCPGLDPRWAVCQRPAVMVGGELSADMLELRLDPATNIYAAPAQMKANNGILIVDDFGRQVIPPTMLLNRWILPMDRRVDYLNLSYGLKFQVPFEPDDRLCHQPRAETVDGRRISAAYPQQNLRASRPG